MAEKKLRHYEIVFLVHPEHSEQVPALIQRYETIVKEGGGTVHRLEDWGKRQLAYPIKKAQRAHYVLMNVECNAKSLADINHNFRYNEAILRHLVLKRDKAITEASTILKMLQQQTAATEAAAAASAKAAEELPPEALEEIAEATEDKVLSE